MLPPLSMYEARVLMAPYLADYESILEFGPVTVIDDDDDQRALHGMAFLTRSALLFWQEGEEGPDEIFATSDIDSVSADDRVLPGDARQIQVGLVARDPLTIFCSRPMAVWLKGFESGSTRASPQNESGGRPASAPPPPESKAEATPVAALSAPGTKAAVPVRPLNSHLFRIVDPATFVRYSAASSRFVNVAGDIEESEVQDVLDGFVDALLRDIRLGVEAGRLAPCPPDGVQDALRIGVSIALAERRHGWTDESKVHPIVHVSLFLLQESLTDKHGLGAALPLEAAFRCVRQGGYPPDLIVH